MGFKICTIGCGNHSVKVHGPSYKKYFMNSNDVILGGCCDKDPDRAKSYKDKFGFNSYYTDIIHMLKSEKPDVVCLVVPVKVTARLAVKVLEMGYPLIMEKPPGRNSSETKKLMNIAYNNKIPTRVAFNRRYIPLVRKLKEYLFNNVSSSDIQSIHYDMFRTGRYDRDFSTTAIHAVDAVRFIVEADYNQIRFSYQNFDRQRSGVKNIFMDSFMTSGVFARISLCPIAGVVMERAVINACDNTFLLDIPIWNAYDFPGRLVHLRKGKVVADVDGNDISDGEEIFETGGFYYENASFFDALRAGKKAEGNIITSLQSVEVAEHMRRNEAEYNIQS